MNILKRLLGGLQLANDFNFYNIQGCTKDGYCQASIPMASSYPYLNNSIYKLDAVQMLIRHGDRTPTSLLPVIPINWISKVNQTEAEVANKLLLRYRHFEEKEAGLLTIKGQQQLSRLGNELKSIYMDNLEFLPIGWNASLSRVHCSLFTRTFLSAKHLVESLFQNNDKTVESIPIYTTSHRGNHDLLTLIVSNESQCKKLRRTVDKFKALVHKSPTGSEMAQLEYKLRHDMRLRTSFSAFADFMNCACCHEESGAINLFKLLPSRACQVSREYKRAVYDQFLHDKQAIRLASGPLVQELYRNFESKDYKMMIYTTHDSVLGHLHRALETGKYDWPPYASNIILEKYSIVNATENRIKEVKKRNHENHIAKGHDHGNGTNVSFHLNNETFDRFNVTVIGNFTSSYNTTIPFSHSHSIIEEKMEDHYVRIIYNGELLRLPWYNNAKDPTLCPWSNFEKFVIPLLPLKEQDECQI